MTNTTVCSIGTPMQAASKLSALANQIRLTADRTANVVDRNADDWTGLGRVGGQRSEDAIDTLSRCDDALADLQAQIARYRKQIANSKAES